MKVAGIQLLKCLHMSERWSDVWVDYLIIAA